MSRARIPAPTTGFLVKLPSDLAVALEAYCRANEGTARINVVRNAIRTYIDWRLEADAQLRLRFEEEARSLRQTPGLRVIKGDPSEWRSGE
jgi:hypothetical protein